MTITVAQVGTPGVVASPGTTATATLPVAPTVGNLITVASSNSSGSQSLTILEGGSFATAGIQNASPREKIYWGLATGIERTFTVNAAAGAIAVQVREWNLTQALTVNNATGTNAFPFTGTTAPGTLTGPVASQAGEALAIALLGASTGVPPTVSFAGLAASGWTVTTDDLFGRAGQAFKTMTLTAGVTQASFTPTWTTARNGNGLLVVFAAPITSPPALTTITPQQQRRGTAADWASVNPVLRAGEIGFETDTRKMKIGDGVTDWNHLGYVIGG